MPCAFAWANSAQFVGFQQGEHKDTGQTQNIGALRDGEVLRPQLPHTGVGIGEEAALAVRRNQHHIDAGAQVITDSDALCIQTQQLHSPQNCLAGTVTTKHGLQLDGYAQPVQHSGFIKGIAAIGHTDAVGGGGTCPENLFVRIGNQNIHNGGTDDCDVLHTQPP